MERYYDCYSFPLMQFLLKNGIVPEKVTQNPATKKTVWVFRMTKELDKYLQKWTRNKPRK